MSDKKILGEEVGTEAPEAKETVIPEVMSESKNKKSAVADENKEIKALKKQLKAKDNQLADKDSQINVLGSLTKSKTRGDVKKEVKTPCGTIRIYDMKG